MELTNLDRTMDDFPTKIADLLESTATRVRTMTVDRVAGWVRWAAIGAILLAIGLLVVIFLLVLLFRVLGSLFGGLFGDDEWGFITAYAVLGGLFAVGGAFLWSKRLASSKED